MSRSYRWRKCASVAILSISQGCELDDLKSPTMDSGHSVSAEPDSAATSLADSGLDTSLPGYPADTAGDDVPPPEFAEACPTGPFRTGLEGAYREAWAPARHPMETSGAPAHILVSLLETPNEWGNEWVGFWDGLTVDRGSSRQILTEQSGWYRFGVLPVAADGRAGAQLVCDLEYLHSAELTIEVASDPLFFGHREAHFVVEGGDMFATDDDLCWCNPHIVDTGGDGETDDLVLSEGRGHPDYWPMSQIHSTIRSLAPGPQRRELMIFDLGDGELESPGMPFETEVRVFHGAELVFSDRGRVPRGEVWRVGIMDMGRMTFEPADPEEFEVYRGSAFCE